MRFKSGVAATLAGVGAAAFATGFRAVRGFRAIVDADFGLTDADLTFEPGEL